MKNNDATWYQPAEGTTAYDVQMMLRVVLFLAMGYMGILCLTLLMEVMAGI